jgi:microcystin-dependent protein
MSDQYVGEIRMFSGNFPPKGWAFCNGQLLSISQNTALFSLLGTNFGGDGRSTFALPDFQGRTPLSQGQGQGLTPRVMGEVGGQAAVTLLVSEIPIHSHLPSCDSAGGGQAGPGGNVWGKIPGKTAPQMYSSNPPNVAMAANAVGNTGDGQPHNNRQPYLCVNFIISLGGIFPLRP